MSRSEQKLCWTYSGGPHHDLVRGPDIFNTGLVSTLRESTVCVGMNNLCEYNFSHRLIYKEAWALNMFNSNSSLTLFFQLKRFTLILTRRNSFDTLKM